MERLKERLVSATQAFATLEELVALPHPSRVERDAAIQRFAYTFEACWKAAQRYLLVIEGVNAGSPKACIRACRDAGLFSDEQAVVGLEMSDDRNLTAHTYNELVAEGIHRNLPRYASMMRHWLTAMQARMKT